MKNTIEFELLLDVLSDELYQTRYIIGKVGNAFLYAWSDRMSGEEVEITASMISRPRHDHGAMVGTAEKVSRHILDCVGQHRFDTDAETAEAAQEIVDEMLATIAG